MSFERKNNRAWNESRKPEFTVSRQLPSSCSVDLSLFKPDAICDYRLGETHILVGLKKVTSKVPRRFRVEGREGMLITYRRMLQEKKSLKAKNSKISLMLNKLERKKMIYFWRDCINRALLHSEDRSLHYYKVLVEEIANDGGMDVAGVQAIQLLMMYQQCAFYGFIVASKILANSTTKQLIIDPDLEEQNSGEFDKICLRACIAPRSRVIYGSWPFYLGDWDGDKIEELFESAFKQNLSQAESFFRKLNEDDSYVAPSHTLEKEVDLTEIAKNVQQMNLLQ